MLLDRVGDEEADARRALAECQAALTHRSPERNAVDHAFTAADKGLALHRLVTAGAPAPAGREQFEASSRCYVDALKALPPHAEPALPGRIRYNLTSLYHTGAHRFPQDRELFLNRAVECARRSADVHGEHSHPHELAFVQRQLAQALMRRAEESGGEADRREARALPFQALKVLTPGTRPGDAPAAADEARRVCRELDDWEGVSLASGIALSAWRNAGGELAHRDFVPGAEGADGVRDDPVLAGLEHEGRYRFTAYALFRAAEQARAEGAAEDAPAVRDHLQHAVEILVGCPALPGRARPALRAARGQGPLRAPESVTRGRGPGRPRLRTLLGGRPYAGPEYWAGFVLQGC
ncbi:hypothetical protein [Streptomyces sp. NPDC058457]|uniref:hypothetical protein n=1 Tax=Streptomyces sp. NPDC058457 TaxID=3346507 RepID=UPI003669ED14